MSMSMNISISDEVYEFLKEMKTKDNLSFSQVIRKLKQSTEKEKGSFQAVMELYGAAKDMEVDYKAMQDLRDEIEERLCKR